jgi:hypothetical protein
MLFILRLIRRRQMHAKYAFLWLSVGMMLVLLAASPKLLDRVSGVVGVYYAPATFFLGALAFLFLVVIHFSWELSRLEDRIRSLSEELAVSQAEPPRERRQAEISQRTGYGESDAS